MLNHIDEGLDSEKGIFIQGQEIYSWKQKKMTITYKLIYIIISLSTRAVIGQFCGPYSPVQPAKFESFFSCAPD